MNNKAIVFMAGAVCGSLATYIVVKKRFSDIATKQIEEAKTKPEKNPGDILVETKSEEPEEPEKKETTDDYKKIVESYNRNAAYHDIAAKESPIEEDVLDPYIISPNEYGEAFGYDTLSFTYYADGVLTDDAEAIIEDYESILCKDFMDHFGEYEDDSVFVRNDRLKTDYEILLDTRTYEQMLAKNPHLRGVNERKQN